VRRSLVTFRSGDRTLSAEIVAPAQAGTRGPGVLFVHWLGDAATTNHKEFESDARALAAKGATCVLLDAMWSTVVNGKRDWFSTVRSTGSDYRHSIEQVVDLRRSLDLLIAQPGVDPERIAYVAHDFGAMYGAVLAGVDPRPRYYVLMAGTTSFADWYLLGKKPADVAAYRAQMAPLDPLPYLTRSPARGFLFQFAAHDQYVTAAHATEFFSAAPVPRAMYVYDAHHDLKVPLALRDRLSWLQARLF
jgi:dienelactone hydrolase